MASLHGIYIYSTVLAARRLNLWHHRPQTKPSEKSRVRKIPTPDSLTECRTFLNHAPALFAAFLRPTWRQPFRQGVVGLRHQ